MVDKDYYIDTTAPEPLLHMMLSLSCWPLDGTCLLFRFLLFLLAINVPTVIADMKSKWSTDHLLFIQFNDPPPCREHWSTSEVCQSETIALNTPSSLHSVMLNTEHPSIPSKGQPFHMQNSGNIENLSSSWKARPCTSIYTTLWWQPGPLPPLQYLV